MIFGEQRRKWRHRRLYPGGASSVDCLSRDGEIKEATSASPVDASETGSGLTGLALVVNDLTPAGLRSTPLRSSVQEGPVKVNGGLKSMDSFGKYQRDVSDAWSTEELAEEDNAGSSRQDDNYGSSSSRLPGATSNGRVSGQNRHYSEHLRAKGLQRLAMQSSGRASLPAHSAIASRPGLAVRSSSVNANDGLDERPPSSSSLQSLLPRHSQKSDKFDKVLSMPSLDMEELRRLSWSGIPSQLRANVWRLLCGHAPPVSSKQKLEDTLHRKREEYQSLVHDYYPKRHDDQYKDTFRQIHIDVPRMCPLIPLFQQIVVQELFERVLFIWALRNPASGYVQGINDLVTPYFMVFLRQSLALSPEEDMDNLQLDQVCSSAQLQAKLPAVEADSFWCLSKLLSSIQSNYTFAQPGIQQRVVQLKDLVQRVDAPLHRHLEKCTVEYLQFSFRWMNNLLIRELPLKCIIRLWDSYHSEMEGFAHFHVYVCASFLLWWSEDLRNQPDFQHCLLLLQNLPTQNWGEDEVERLLAKAYMLKYSFADAPRHLRA
ncbi:hypothetical protein RvY_18148 [Ramazzottius varieornatus]|uniref:Rab-GAP TBC domain-containing protein n=1 Tax=Ramazzottius varieornatus TaxID=947166 RepID=A0A1D1W4P9_RAMVA|nr:hypothetical protein RvY_18148 [Ramazzottius varieornatus]